LRARRDQLEFRRRRALNDIDDLAKYPEESDRVSALEARCRALSLELKEMPAEIAKLQELNDAEKAARKLAKAATVAPVQPCPGPGQSFKPEPEAPVRRETTLGDRRADGPSHDEFPRHLRSVHRGNEQDAFGETESVAVRRNA
jgi:hypothetical protein